MNSSYLPVYSTNYVWMKFFLNKFGPARNWHKTLACLFLSIQNRDEPLPVACPTCNTFQYLFCTQILVHCPIKYTFVLSIACPISWSTIVYGILQGFIYIYLCSCLCCEYFFFLIQAVIIHQWEEAEGAFVHTFFFFWVYFVHT